MNRKLAKRKKVVDVLNLPAVKRPETRMFTVDLTDEDRRILDELRGLLAERGMAAGYLLGMPTKAVAFRTAIRLACDHLRLETPGVDKRIDCTAKKIQR